MEASLAPCLPSTGRRLARERFDRLNRDLPTHSTHTWRSTPRAGAVWGFWGCSGRWGLPATRAAWTPKRSVASTATSTSNADRRSAIPFASLARRSSWTHEAGRGCSSGAKCPAPAPLRADPGARIALAERLGAAEHAGARMARCAWTPHASPWGDAMTNIPEIPLRETVRERMHWRPRDSQMDYCGPGRSRSSCAGMIQGQGAFGDPRYYAC